VSAHLFSAGDTVEWTSQAGGRITQKRGSIFATVPAQTSPADVLGVKTLEDYRTAVVRFDGKPRDEVSFLVLVPYTTRARPRLYWPRANALKMVESAPSPSQAKAPADSQPNTIAELYLARRDGAGRIHVDDGLERACCNEYVAIDGKTETKSWIRVDRPETDDRLCRRCQTIVAEQLAAKPIEAETGYARHYENGKADFPIHRTYLGADNVGHTVCNDTLVRTKVDRVPVGYHFCAASPRDACETCEFLVLADWTLTRYAEACDISLEEALWRRRRQHLALGALPRKLRAV
jgi:hypothetical protein